MLLSKSSRIYPERITRDAGTDLCTRMFIAALLTNMKEVGDNLNAQQQGTH